MKKRLSIWQNFLIIMSIAFVLVVIITFLNHRRAVALMKEENSKANMYQAIQAEENFTRLLEQVDRLAASVSINEKVQAFWYNQTPENLFDDFYETIEDVLISYTYSMRSYISSVMLYAPSYGRVQSGGMNRPYILTGTARDAVENADWTDLLEDMGEEKIRTQLEVRAVNNSYPYVLTVMKQFKSGSEWGVVAIDIDLTKMYDEIWNDTKENTYLWILDEKSRIVIRESKNELYAQMEDFQLLSDFEKNWNEIFFFQEDSAVPITFAQRYMEEYGFYVVTVTELPDFNQMIMQERLRAVGIGMGVIIIVCILLSGYAYITRKTMKNTMMLLKNPLDFHEHIVRTEREVQEVADFIVSNLQSNEALEKELENRLQSLRQTQMQALKAQISPHFLFNTLNVIVMLIDEEVEDSQAAHVTMALADVLDYALSDDELVSLSEEIEYTKKYVSILEQRYRGKLQTSFDMETEIMNAKVPKLVLQPIVENAIFHGISAKIASDGGRLTITGKKERYFLDNREMWVIRIDITDNGQGMQKEKVDELLESIGDEHISMEHIGIQNVAKRLALLFRKQSKLEIVSELGKGTKVSLIFPYNDAVKA